MDLVEWSRKAKEVLANLRVFPRALIILYAVIFWFVTNWFMGLTEPTSQHAAFVSTIVGAAAAFFGLYVNSGK